MCTSLRLTHDTSKHMYMLLLLYSGVVCHSLVAGAVGEGLPCITVGVWERVQITAHYEVWLGWLPICEHI